MLTRKQGLYTTVDHYEKTQARLIANSGIEMYLEKLRRDKTLKGEFGHNEALDGYYNMSITGPDSFMTISSTGYFGTTVHESMVQAQREPVEIPPVMGALYISSDNLSVMMNGNLVIDGNDYNVDGTAGPEDPLPGIAVDDPSDSAFVVDELKPKILNDIEGLDGAPSVHSVEDNTDWLAVTQNLIFAADITLSTGTYANGTVLGTPTEPKITYVTGDVLFSGDAVGDGIMVVNGDVYMTGNFTYRGVVIVYGQSTIETDIVGNGGIYGTTILVADDVDIKATGNASLYYSSEAINNAAFYLKSSRFKILSWWE